MGEALSVAEKKQLLPHLRGFKPHALASIIWDTVNEVCTDDRRDSFGILFDQTEKDETLERGECEAEKEEDEIEVSKCAARGDKERVTFWDKEMIQTLPLPIFMDILMFVGEETVRSYEEHYDISKNNDVSKEVDKLKVALEYLQNKLQSMERSGTTEDYRIKVDLEGKDDRDCEQRRVARVRERRGTQVWSAGESDCERESGRQRGMESVISRHPALKKQYRMASFDHNKKKLTRGKSLSIKRPSLTSFNFSGKTMVRGESLVDKRSSVTSIDYPDRKMVRGRSVVIQGQPSPSNSPVSPDINISTLPEAPPTSP